MHSRDRYVKAFKQSSLEVAHPTIHSVHFYKYIMFIGWMLHMKATTAQHVHYPLPNPALLIRSGCMFLQGKSLHNS